MRKNKVGRLIDERGNFSKTHGRTGDSIYSIWASMLQRVRDPNSQRYADYGGRGIKVCKRWLTFENFLSDMGERPLGKSLDRINNDGDYKPSNCRWATRTEQARNTRRSKMPIKIDGATMSIKEAAIKYGVDYRSLWWRLKNGWTVEQACKTPLVLGRNDRVN